MHPVCRRGIGSTVVNMLARQLRDQGHREIIIDPNPANARAVRAYEKAGFRTIAALAGQYDDVLLMRYDPATVLSPNRKTA